MASLHEICVFLDDILKLDKFSDDPSNNGLQFEGVDEVKKAVFAVDACEAVFQAAIDLDADFIFVHHGISWGSGIKRVTGSMAKRITLLAANGVSLYGAHLPLDANEMMGHNALIADIISLENLVPFGDYHGKKIGFRGELETPVSLNELAEFLDQELPSEGDFKIIGDPDKKVRNIAVISGGGAWPELFDEIRECGVECLITGEATHEVYHPALEADTHILTLGHYRSETPGVIAVMNTLREKFQLETEFIDCPTNM